MLSTLTCGNGIGGWRVAEGKKNSSGNVLGTHSDPDARGGGNFKKPKAKINGEFCSTITRGTIIIKASDIGDCR